MNIGEPWPDLEEAEHRVHVMQTKLHQWAISDPDCTNGIIPWRAGCGESRTSGSEGGPEKPTIGNGGRALRSDPYTYLPGAIKGLLFYLLLGDSLNDYDN